MKIDKEDKAVLWIFGVALALAAAFMLTVSIMALLLDEKQILASNGGFTALAMGIAVVVVAAAFVELAEARIKRRYDKAMASRSNVGVLAGQAKRLYAQGLKFVDLYMGYESEIQKEAARSRILAQGLSCVVEQYPQLKSSEQAAELINKTEKCEMQLMHETVRYNYLASLFNGQAAGFPGKLLAKLHGLRPLAYSNTPKENDKI